MQKRSKIKLFTDELIQEKNIVNTESNQTPTLALQPKVLLKNPHNKVLPTLPNKKYGRTIKKPISHPNKKYGKVQHSESPSENVEVNTIKNTPDRVKKYGKIADDSDDIDEVINGKSIELVNPFEIRKPEKKFIKYGNNVVQLESRSRLLRRNAETQAIINNQKLAHNTIDKSTQPTQKKYGKLKIKPVSITDKKIGSNITAKRKIGANKLIEKEKRIIPRPKYGGVVRNTVNRTKKYGRTQSLSQNKSINSKKYGKNTVKVLVPNDLIDSGAVDLSKTSLNLESRIKVLKHELVDLINQIAEKYTDKSVFIFEYLKFIKDNEKNPTIQFRILSKTKDYCNSILNK